MIDLEPNKALSGQDWLLREEAKGIRGSIPFASLRVSPFMDAKSKIIESIHDRNHV